MKERKDLILAYVDIKCNYIFTLFAMKNYSQFVNIKDNYLLKKDKI